MKKILSVVIIISLLMTFTISTNAAEIDWSDEVAPCWEYISSINPNVNFSGTTGTADVTVARIYGVTTFLEATLTVYKQVGSDWIAVASQYGSSTRSLGISFDFDAEHGATYKVEADVTAYCDDQTEHTVASEIRVCP